MKLPQLKNLLLVACMIIVSVTASAQSASRLNLVYCYSLPTINSNYYIAFNQDNMAIKTNFQPDILTVTNNNSVVLTPGKSNSQPAYNFAEIAKNNLRINISDQQNTEYTASSVRHTDKTIVTIGAIFTGVGAAILLSRPIPDFSGDMDGPEKLFAAACAASFAGILTIGVGITSKITVYKPVAYPDLSTDRMKMIPTEENRRVQSSIAELLKSGHITAYDNVKKIKGIPENVTTFDDRMELMINNNKILFYFEDVYLNGVTYGESYENYKKVKIGNMEFRRDGDIATLDSLKNSLIYIRKQLRRELENQIYSDKLDAFKPTAAKYRAMDIKPALSEELRKKIVQADVYREQNKFAEAVSTLNSALEMDPIAYPSGYSNIAYLYERLSKYHDAILNMKKYLLLEPFADDARQSQDKIYEWELLLNK